MKRAHKIITVALLVFASTFLPLSGMTNVFADGEFDGKAYLIWSCEDGSLCYHYFDNILTNEHNDFPTTIIPLATVTNENTTNPGEVFKLNAEKKDWALPAALTQWNTDAGADWKTSSPDYVLYGNPDSGVDGVSLNPLQAASGNHSYASFGDHNFKAIVYDTDYAAATLGNQASTTYFPDFWNPIEFNEYTDISGTTATAPALIQAYIGEPTITIKSDGTSGVNFTGVTPQNVPANIVTVTNGVTPGSFNIEFKSNFYDHVIFAVSASNGQTYYIQINRVAFEVRQYRNTTRFDVAVYYSATSGIHYNNLEVIAKIVRANGETINAKVAHTPDYEDRLGNQVTGQNEGPGGNGLLMADYAIDLKDYGVNNPVEDINGIYFNVKYTGSTTTNFAGTFTGHSKGLYFDFENPRDRQHFGKINFDK